MTATVLVTGITWTLGTPHLNLTSPHQRHPHQMPLTGTRLAFTTTPGRYCTGATTATGHHPCPGHAPATTGRQCDRCTATDEFRLVHHAHRGGHTTSALRHYLTQPQWLYLATFADGTPKIGTTTRPDTRLAEQGALRATHLTLSPNGYTVRTLEDTITRETGITQAVRAATKTTALIHPLTPTELDHAHTRAVTRALAVLARAGITPNPTAWTPPPEHTPVLTAATPALYPHRLTEGSHCLTIHGLIGSTALATINDTDQHVLADLSTLTGHRITPGNVTSPATTTQHPLF